MTYHIPNFLRRDYRKNKCPFTSCKVHSQVIPDIEGGKKTYRATKLEIVLGILVVLFALGFVWVGNLYIDLALGL